VEDKMIWIFLIALWVTFILTRINASLFHDFQTYNKHAPKKSQAKTLSGFLRRKTGFDWHHIHLGFIILIILLPFILINGLTNLLTIFLAVGLSFVFDQVLPWLDLGNYFSKKMLLISVIFHILISIIAIFMLS